MIQNDTDLHHAELILMRWHGLSARQWGEDSDAGESDGPRARAIAELESLIAHYHTHTH